MMPYIISGVVVTAIAVWFISTQRVLAMLAENIDNAMNRIGVLLSIQWDALSVLLDLAKGHTEHNYQILFETIKARRPITSESSAQEAAAQDNILVQAMGHITTLAEQYPALKSDQSYQKTMDSVNQYEGMVYQSRLIYNDSVTKLNRRIRMFPTSAIARILGFNKCNYMEALEGNAEMPCNLL